MTERDHLLFLLQHIAKQNVDFRPKLLTITCMVSYILNTITGPIVGSSIPIQYALFYPYLEYRPF